MRFSELLALGYFLIFLAAALVCLLRGRPAWRTAGISALGIAFVSLAPQAPDLLLSDVFIPLRDWWLLAALPLAYWAPAPLTGSPNERLERWLLRVDEKLGLISARASELFELAYLLVYPMVPAGLLASSEGELFWRAVLIAVLPCYGLLPLLPTRPPRALAPGASTADGSMFRVANVGFLRVFGNVWNTLPSGHAAGAAAVAVKTCGQQFLDGDVTGGNTGSPCGQAQQGAGDSAVHALSFRVNSSSLSISRCSPRAA